MNSLDIPQITTLTLRPQKNSSFGPDIILKVNGGWEKLQDHIKRNMAFKHNAKYGLYFGETFDGWVQFYAYNGPSHGFGGRHIHITMKDGTTRTLKGPGSCRSGFMEYAGFTPCTEVLVDNVVYYMTVDALRPHLQAAGYDLERHIHFDREPYYHVVEMG